MFVAGLLIVAIGLVGAYIAAFPPVEEARWGAIGVAIGCGLGGATLVYLDAPSQRRKPPPGKVSATATVLEATGSHGSVAGYQMVELTLEVRPKDGTPFQVRRTFSAGRLGRRVEPGRRFDVFYDPADPERIELA